MQVKDWYNFIWWHNGVKVRPVHDKKMFLIDSKYLAMETDFSQNRKLTIQKKKKNPGLGTRWYCFMEKGKEIEKKHILVL